MCVFIFLKSKMRYLDISKITTLLFLMVLFYVLNHYKNLYGGTDRACYERKEREGAKDQAVRKEREPEEWGLFRWEAFSKIK